MRVFERIVKADRSRIVTRTFDVSSKITLPRRREKPFRHCVRKVDEKTLVFPPRVEHFFVRAVVVFGVPHVRLYKYTTTLQSFGHFEYAAGLWDASTPRAADTSRERTARFSTARPYGNDPLMRPIRMPLCQDPARYQSPPQPTDR